MASETTFLSDVRYLAGRNRLTMIAGLVMIAFIALAIVGPWIAPHDPLLTSAKLTLAPPSLDHPFGADALGRDILSRVIVATRLDITMALGAVAISFAVGTWLGAIAGYYGGWIEALIGRLMDTIMAFPLFVLAMGIVAALGNSVANIVLATAIINLPFYARFARAEIGARRELAYVEAAKMSGHSGFAILLNHLIPNILPTMMVQASLNLGWAILNAAGLSFIGLGVRPPTPEWGIMVSEGASYIFSGEWWTFTCPGFALVLAVFCFNLIGDGLRDLMDPRART